MEMSRHSKNAMPPVVPRAGRIGSLPTFERHSTFILRRDGWLASSAMRSGCHELQRPRPSAHVERSARRLRAQRRWLYNICKFSLKITLLNALILLLAPRVLEAVLLG